MKAIHLVTGAFGYSGRYIARQLLEAGHEVRTLTRSPGRSHPFGDRIQVFPLDFDDEKELERSLNGVDVLYNTYWVRFSKAGFSQDLAVRNTRRLIDAARRARIGRIVHVSITNPSDQGPYEYFRGKAQLERSLRDSGLSHAILRPAVIYGPEDILINNIAWMLRRFPVFGLFGSGDYRLQPIFVEDFAQLALEMGTRCEDVVVDAVGPENFTYRELVALIASAIGRRRPLVRTPPSLGCALAWMLGKFVGDVVLTREEIGALMDGLLATHSPPVGETRLSDWVGQHSELLGQRYSSELARRRDRRRAYADL